MKMKMKNEQLYEDLMVFPLEQTGGSFTFLHRLCRENGWSKAFGEKALEEYKRFLYLACVSPTPVTPSEQVDQVWHLHLVYTRSYWQDLCGETLGRQLHHGPTNGGQEEDEKYTDWYDRTKALYEEEFGEKPPTALWPATAERFDPAQRLRWLDTSRNWVIPKPSWTKLAAYGLSGSILFPLLPIMAVALLAVILQWVFSASRASRKARAGSSDGGDSSFDGGSDSGSSSSDCGDAGGSCGDGGGGGCSSGCGGGGCGGGGD